MRAAVAVELVHSATLVHDDLIDGAPAAARTSDGGGGRRARAGDRDRRSAVLAGVRRARAQRGRRAAARALAGQLGARRRRAAAARGRLRLARRGRALPETLRAEDRGAVRGRLPAGSAHGAGGLRAPSPTRSERSPGASGSPSRCSTTCSTCPGRSSAPASRAAGTCSTARSRCPSSWRASASRSWPRSIWSSLERPEQAEALCERIAATGALDEARGAGSGGGRAGQGGAAGDPPRRPLGAAGHGGRRGRRALPIEAPGGAGLSKSLGSIRSASSARMKNSISSDMFACVTRLRSPSSAAAARSSSSSSRSTAACSKMPSRLDSHSGQRSTILQCRGPSSDQSSGKTSSPAQ